MAKLVVGMSQSLDGYVDHVAFASWHRNPHFKAISLVNSASRRDCVITAGAVAG